MSGQPVEKACRCPTKKEQSFILRNSWTHVRPYTNHIFCTGKTTYVSIHVLNYERMYKYMCHTDAGTGYFPFRLKFLRQRTKQEFRTQVFTTNRLRTVKLINIKYIETRH